MKHLLRAAFVAVMCSSGTLYSAAPVAGLEVYEAKNYYKSQVHLLYGICMNRTIGEAANIKACELVSSYLKKIFSGFDLKSENRNSVTEKEAEIIGDGYVLLEQFGKAWRTAKFSAVDIEEIKNASSFVAFELYRLALISPEVEKQLDKKPLPILEKDRARLVTESAQVEEILQKLISISSFVENSEEPENVLELRSQLTQEIMAAFDAASIIAELSHQEDRSLDIQLGRYLVQLKDRVEYAQKLLGKVIMKSPLVVGVLPERERQLQKSLNQAYALVHFWRVDLFGW